MKEGDKLPVCCKMFHHAMGLTPGVTKIWASRDIMTGDQSKTRDFDEGKSGMKRWPKRRML